MEKTRSIGTLERGLDLLECMAKGRSEKSISELSRETQLNPSTIYRILSIFKARDYVRQNISNSKYMLTFKLFELGNMVDSQINLKQEALPILEKLAEETKESAFLTIKDGNEALCLERIDGNPHIRVLELQKGGRMPLNIGGGPKAILAHLSDEEIDRFLSSNRLIAWTAKSNTNQILLKKEIQQIREQGYALSLGDATEDVAAIGCPVINASGEVVAAVSIVGLENTLIRENMNTFINLVKTAAKDLADRLELLNP